MHFENQQRSVAQHKSAANRSIVKGTSPNSLPLTDNRPEIATQRKFLESVNAQLKRQNTTNAGENVVQRTVYGGHGETFNTGTFLIGRERPTSVETKVKSKPVGQRGRTPTPISLLHNPGNPDGGADNKPGFDGGHIVGLSLGGPDASYNVVPMYPGFNRGVWKNLESEMKNDARWAYSGMNYTIKIDIQYNTVNSKTPQSLSVKGYAYVPPKGKKGKPQRKMVKNYGTFTQPDDITVTAPLDLKDQKIITGDQIPRRLTGINNRAAIRLEEERDQLSGNYLRVNKHFPPSLKTEYPDDPTDRPYEYLDILTYAGEMNPGTTFSPGRLFSGRQRELILQANMARNGGQIRSDDPADPYPDLSEKGAANFPEIDHIIPKSLGGSNWFSNARVVSWQLNNRDDRIKDISGLVDVSRLANPAMPNGTIAEKAMVIAPIQVVKQGPITLGNMMLQLSQIYNINVTANWRNAVEDALEAKVTSGEFTKDIVTDEYDVA